MIEKLLQQELTEFLKYDKYFYEGRNSGNSRNDYYTRNYETRYGIIVNLNIPRDRKSEFEQQLIKPSKIIYAKLLALSEINFIYII